MATPNRCWPKSALNAERARAGDGGAGPLRAARALEEGRAICWQRAMSARAVENVMPSEMYLLARELAAERSRIAAGRRDPRGWRRKRPEALSPQAISRAFGTPKPTLANSYRAGAAEPADVPDADGIFQPDPGRELGIEPAVLRGAGG